MKKETAGLVDLQELFEMAGLSIFLDDFDVSGFIASIKNEDGIWMPFSPERKFFSCTQ